MRHIVAIAAAVGFLFAASAPTLAATDLSAAKKVDCSLAKNKNNKACKKADLTSTDMSAAKKKVDCSLAKNAKNKACKKAELTSTDLSAAKKKVDCSLAKNKNNKACKKM